MSRNFTALALVLMLAVLVASPALAADPNVSKRVMMDEGDGAVVVLDVSAAGRSVYGVTISDPSGSIQDIVAPDGWAGVAGEDRVVFRTVDKPIRSGASVAFRIVTKNAGAGLNVTFFDAKTQFGAKKNV